MSSEQYQPSSKEIEMAENMMTSEQEGQSEWREYRARQLDPDYEKEQEDVLREDEAYEEFERILEREKETVIEVEVPLKVKVPIGYIMREGRLGIITSYAELSLGSGLLKQLNEKYPKIIEDINCYWQNRYLLGEMITSEGPKPNKTHHYNSEEAKRLLAENRAIMEKYGGDFSLDLMVEGFVKRFGKLGDKID